VTVNPVTGGRSLPYTCTTSAAFTADRPWRAGCSDKLHAQFGEGWLEKERARATSLASYSTCTSGSKGEGAAATLFPYPTDGKGSRDTSPAAYSTQHTRDHGSRVISRRPTAPLNHVLSCHGQE